MAHFAKLNNDNEVVQVLVVNNNVILNADNTESEYKGKVFLNGLFGNATWVQTSYNGNIRKQFAGIGYTYDETNDIFIKPQPFASWVLDSDFEWEAPVPYPTDGKPYSWDEDTISWGKPNCLYPSWTWNEAEWEWQPPIAYPSDFDTVAYQWNEENQTWDLIE